MALIPGQLSFATDARARRVLEDERRTVFVLIAVLWSIIKVMFLLRTGALDSIPALQKAFSGLVGLNQILVVVVCVALSLAVYRVLSLVRSKSLFVQACVALLCTAGFIGALAAYGAFATIHFLDGSFAGWPATIKGTVISGWAPFALYSAAVLALIKSTEARLKDARNASLEVAVREEQLRALRMQLDPHFMGNSLGAVSALILQNRLSEANDMARRLARFLRENANSGEQTATMLEDELDTIESYLEIESLRFGPRLRVKVNSSPEIGAAIVPSFILQPLVENSIKHAVSASGAPVLITISALRDGGDLVLAVEDDGQASAGTSEPGEGGIGLENTRSRLQIRYGAAGTVEATPLPRGFRTSLRFPYSTKIGADQLR